MWNQPVGQVRQQYGKIICEYLFTPSFENKIPAETFAKFPSIIHVIDRSDRNSPITVRLAWRKEGVKVTLVAVIGGLRSDLSITRKSCNFTDDVWTKKKTFCTFSYKLVQISPIMILVNSGAFLSISSWFCELTELIFVAKDYGSCASSELYRWHLIG